MYSKITAEFEVHVLIWAKHYSAAAINQEICFVYGLKPILVMNEQA